jgi:penicillin-binding protein 1A
MLRTMQASPGGRPGTFGRALLRVRQAQAGASAWLARRSWRLIVSASIVLAFVTLVGFSFGWITHRYPLEEALKPLPAGTAIAIDEVPETFIQALLAMEDRRFYDHSGVDIEGIVRAAWRNLQAGQIVEGGSTITQQLARLIFLTPERTLKRKVQEAAIAIWLELNMSKDRILESYLSQIYLGDGCYGLRAAARHYFGKEPRELTLSESVLLVAIIRAPSALAPTRHFEAASMRARLVLDAMVEAGYLTEPQAAAVTPERPLAEQGAAPALSGSG